MKLLSNVWNWKLLKGYKHIVAILLVALVYGLERLGYIGPDLAGQLELLLVALGIKAAADHQVKK